MHDRHWIAYDFQDGKSSLSSTMEIHDEGFEPWKMGLRRMFRFHSLMFLFLHNDKNCGSIHDRMVRSSRRRYAEYLDWSLKGTNWKQSNKDCVLGRFLVPTSFYLIGEVNFWSPKFPSGEVWSSDQTLAQNIKFPESLETNIKLKGSSLWFQQHLFNLNVMSYDKVMMFWSLDLTTKKFAGLLNGQLRWCQCVY